MESFGKEKIKGIKKEGKDILITMQKEVKIDEIRLKFLWEMMKKREVALNDEKERLIEISKKSGIKLE